MTGGRLLPDSIVDSIVDNVERRGVLWSDIRHTFPPLTRWQRLQIRLAGFRAAIHDRLFPECREAWD